MSGLLSGDFWHEGTKDNLAVFYTKLNAQGMRLWNCTAPSLLLAMVLCRPGSQQSTLGLASAGGSVPHVSRGIVSVAGGEKERREMFSLGCGEAVSWH